MEKRPLFFRNAGEMGDVLSQAKGLAKKVQLLKAQQAEVLAQKQELEKKQNEVDPGQKEILAKELQNISRLEETVSEKLARLERTQEAIENIINENQDKIREKILTREEVEFIKLKYFTLIRSRLATKSITSPVSSNSYCEKDWKLTLMENEIVAKTMRGIIKSHNDLYFDIIYSVPFDLEGYVYKKKGMEVTDLIKNFINTRDNESYNALVLACPTGWSDEIKSHVETMSHSSASVYLVDLAEKQMFFNRNDEKTMNLAEWFAPLSMDDEINDLVEKLKLDIKNGDIQFRADKVVEKYKVPRKIVISAFHNIAESKNAELIDRSEGAKDIILLMR